MAAQGRLIDYKQSGLDQSLYFIYFLVPKDKPLHKLIANVNVSQYVKRDASLGFLEDSQGLKTSILSPVSGTIVEINAIPNQIKVEKRIQIFSIKICQHFPKTKNQSQLLNSQTLQSLICMYCDEPLQFYYQIQDKLITYYDLKKSFQKFDQSEFSWNMVLNQKFTKDTQICSTGDQTYSIPQTGKITFMYNFQNSSDQRIDPEKVVLKYKKIVCQHQKIQGKSGICLLCLTNIKNVKNVNLRRYLFQYDQQNFNPNLFISGNTLQNQVKAFKNKIIKRRKCVLVLDLDNTILHSISHRRVSELMRSSLDEYVIIPPGQTNPIFIQKTLVKFRPNFEYFLAQVVPLYQIFIYTKGTRLYAEQICRAIKNKFSKILEGTNNFLPHRIISRDQDPDLVKKNLQLVIPKCRDFMLVLDDRRDVWNHSPLCVFTKPYVFFYYVAVTSDGKTKIEPVEWQKGGGTLQHKLNQFQQNCLKKIDEAKQSGQQQVAIQKMKQLEEQVKHSQEQKNPKQLIIGTEQGPDVIEKQIVQSKNNSEVLQKIQQQQKPVQKFDVSGSEQGKQLKNKASIIDQFLITTAFALKQTHTIYFNKLEMGDDQQRKQGKFADLGHSFQQYKKGILDHLSAYFAFRDYKKSPVFRRAQKLGLKIIQNSQDHIDILIRPNNFGEGFPQSSAGLAKKHSNLMINKVKSTAQPKKIPIVSQTWIDTCYEFSCCLQYSKFEPVEPLARVIFNSEVEVQRIVGEATNNAAIKIRQIMQNQNTDPQSVQTK